MPQLDIATYSSQLFWLGICFAILCFAIVRLFVPKLVNILEMREKKMREDLDRARTLKEEIEKLEAENHAALATARAEAARILRNTLDAITEYKTRQLHDFEAELGQKTKQVQETLAQEKQAIIANISNLVTKATMTVTSKLVEKPLDTGEVKAVVKHVMKKKSA